MRERGILERAFLCALGAAGVIEDKVKEIVERLETKGEEKSREISHRIREVRQGRSGLWSRCVGDVFRIMDIPTASDIKRLEDRLGELERLLRERDEKGTS